MATREIVDRLGGVAKVARDLSIEKQTVYKWVQRGAIPEAMAWRIWHVYGDLASREELGLPELPGAAW